MLTKTPSAIPRAPPKQGKASNQWFKMLDHIRSLILAPQVRASPGGSRMLEASFGGYIAWRNPVEKKCQE
jgi:hypothetical protein